MGKLQQVYHKSPLERFFYALLFEVLGIALSTPFAAWLSGQAMHKTGVVAVAVAIIALLLNMAYNTLFDKVLLRYQLNKTGRIRVLHAIGFELSLFLITIPLISWYMQISFWQAIVLDIALVVFYLPYTFLFNLAYDVIRSKIVRK